MQPVMICGSKRITESTQLQDLPVKPGTAAGIPTILLLSVIHIGMLIYGGAVGSKQEHKRTVHAEMATLLLQHSVPLHDIPKTIDTLQRQYGQPKLTHILFGLSQEERGEQLELMCHHAGIPLLDKHRSSAQAREKYQRIEKRRKI